MATLDGNHHLRTLFIAFPYIVICWHLLMDHRCRADNLHPLVSSKVVGNSHTNKSLPDENSFYSRKRNRPEDVKIVISKEREKNLDVGDTFHNNTNNHGNNNTEIVEDTQLRFLVKDLTHKLENVIPKARPPIEDSCKEPISRENSCAESGCFRLSLPRSVRSRVEQLVNPPRLRYNDTYKKVFEDMADSVPGYYDIIMVTGASSNHYSESKALLSHLHKFIFPHLKNFTFVYYDLGLTTAERKDIAEYCRCHVRPFPFSRFPEIFRLLRCYAWKPMIVNAHAPRCNLVHWVDTSIRFSDHRNFSMLESLYERAREYGVQAGCLGDPIPKVTLPSMSHFFGDEPCAYHPYRDITAGFMVFHNEPLIREAVLTPWSACALHEDCMCPYKRVNLKDVLICPRTDRLNAYEYGLCHRFEQSALNIILRKLFQEKSPHILIHDIYKYIGIERGDTVLVT